MQLRTIRPRSCLRRMWFVASVLLFAAAAALHAAGGRVPIVANSVLRFLLIGGVVGLALIILLLLRYGPFSVEWLTGVFIYTFLCSLYIFLFTLTLSSVSANLLFRLSQRPLLPDEVAQLYSGRRMAEVRIERLIGAGFLRREPGGLALTAAGARTVAAYDRLRRLFKHADGPS